MEPGDADRIGDRLEREVAAQVALDVPDGLLRHAHDGSYHGVIVCTPLDSCCGISTLNLYVFALLIVVPISWPSGFFRRPAGIPGHFRLLGRNQPERAPAHQERTCLICALGRSSTRFPAFEGFSTRSAATTTQATVHR